MLSTQLHNPYLYEPVTTDSFAWVNQGSATVDATPGGIFLHAPASGGGQNLRIRKKAAPATPYTITALLLFLALESSGASEVHYGLCFRQSSDGKLATLSREPFNQQTWSTKWNSATSFGAQYVNRTLPGTLQTLNWFRIADDGTNRTVSFSHDGRNFIAYHAVGRTDFLTADEVGFYAAPSNATGGVGVTVLSWKDA
jgi:hypothetical protein